MKSLPFFFYIDIIIAYIEVMTYHCAKCCLNFALTNVDSTNMLASFARNFTS